jgi:hypothetical protein
LSPGICAPLVYSLSQYATKFHAANRSRYCSKSITIHRFRTASRGASVPCLLHHSTRARLVYYRSQKNSTLRQLMGDCRQGISGDDLGPFACSDCGFESRRRHKCLSLASFVRCQVKVYATDRSLIQRNPTDCGVTVGAAAPQEKGNRLYTFHTVHYNILLKETNQHSFIHSFIHSSVIRQVHSLFQNDSST